MVDKYQKKYIIAAPAYRKSGGVRVLYLLYEQLASRGCDVYIYNYNRDGYNDERYRFIDEINDENRKNDIVLYAEVVVGNPLRFQNVVRYILNYPGLLGGIKKYHKSEMKFTFLKKFSPEDDELFINHLDSTLFYQDDTPKTKDCYFVYKGGKWKEIPEFENMTEINMSYPTNRQDLAQLLRETKTLYSYDDCSVLLDEACLCGCDVKIVRKDGFEDYKIEKNFTLDLSSQVDNFIEKTQSMNYTGKIERYYFNLYVELGIIFYKLIGSKKYYKYLGKRFARKGK